MKLHQLDFFLSNGDGALAVLVIDLQVVCIFVSYQLGGLIAGKIDAGQRTIGLCGPRVNVDWGLPPASSEIAVPTPVPLSERTVVINKWLLCAVGVGLCL